MITIDHAGSLRLVMDGFVLGGSDYDSGDLGSCSSQSRPRMIPLVGTPVPAVTNTCSTSGT
jgi:hypothetical protein